MNKKTGHKTHHIVAGPKMLGLIPIEPVPGGQKG
jgi:hypothetical protein